MQNPTVDDIVNSVVENVLTPAEHSTAPSTEDDNRKEVIFNDLDVNKVKVGYPEGPKTNNIEGTLGLQEELSKEEHRIAEIEAKALLERLGLLDQDTNLDTDSNQEPGQAFVVASFVGPTLTAKTDIYGMRVFGAFPTVEEASDFIDGMTPAERRYDTGVVEMYKWVPSYPVAGDTEDAADRFLNDTIVAHRVEVETRKTLFNMRKSRLRENEGRIRETDAPAPDVKLDQESVEKMKADAETVAVEKGPAISSAQARLRKKLEDRRKGIRTPAAPAKPRLDGSNTVTSRVHDQRYVVLCYAGLKGDNRRTAMKIKRVFCDYEEAQRFCKEALAMDDTFDLLVAEMYEWIPCDPKVESIRTVYNNDTLNDMFEAHEEEGRMAAKFHEERRPGGKPAEKYTKEEIMNLYETRNMAPPAQ